VNIEQSIKLISQLLRDFIRFNLFLKVNNTNIVPGTMMPKYAEISLSYFHINEGEKQTSDRRELEFIATNVRGRLDLLYHQVNIKEKGLKLIPHFPDFDHQYQYLQDERDLQKLLLPFLEGNPVNNDVSIRLLVHDLDILKVYDWTKEIKDLEKQLNK